MAYVDGFVLAVSKDKLEDYRKLAEIAGRVWLDHGALTYVECLADDVPYGELTSFPRAVLAKEDEVVIFSWATYPSREARDDTMKKVMADPRMKHEEEQHKAVFDGKRMIWGGFKSFVELEK